MEIIFGLIIAALGGLIALRLKIPAGAMIGGMAAVAIFNIATGMAHFPVEAKVVTKILAGSFIGMKINKKVVSSFRALLKPAIMLCFTILLAGLCIGIGIYATGKFDLVTSLFSCSPGGLLDMTLIAADMGADVSTVTLLQLTRLIGVICICPSINKIMIRKYAGTSFDYDVSESQDVQMEQKSICLSTGLTHNLQTTKIENIKNPSCKQIIKMNIMTIAVGTCGGMVGFFLGVPAGTLMFSMIAVAIFNMMVHEAYMSLAVRRSAQIVAGAVVGQSFGLEQLQNLGNMVLPAIGLVICYIICNLLIAFLLNGICGVEMATALFASTPAGASDMALIASDIGADGPQVALLHIARQVAVIGVYPQIVHLLVSR